MAEALVIPFGGGALAGPVDAGRLGAKGMHLAWLAAEGLPVPPGFVLTTTASRLMLEHGGRLPAALADEIAHGLLRLEAESGKLFGDENVPLLVSVRASTPAARRPRPEAVIDVGMTDAVAAGLEAASGSERFACDCFRRAIATFAVLVHGADRERFDAADHEAVQHARVRDVGELPIEWRHRLLGRYREIFQADAGAPWPQDATRQLTQAIEAVVAWFGTHEPREDGAPDGAAPPVAPAVIVQRMVFGDLGPGDGTLIAFTRDPRNGERTLVGEYLPRSQGDEIVASGRAPERLEALPPAAGEQLERIATACEQLLLSPAALDLVCEREVVHLLSAVPIAARVDPVAAVRIAVEMAHEGAIDVATAVTNVPLDKIEELLRPVPDPHAPRTLVARGTASSPGFAEGRVAVHGEDVLRRSAAGEPVILVQRDLSRDDLAVLARCTGVLTQVGGITSRAALFSRAVRKPAVTGLAALVIEPDAGRVRFGERAFGPEDWLTLDGSTGEVFAGRLPRIEAPIDEPLRTYIEWEETYRPRPRLGARTVAAYRGPLPYSFVSYARADEEAVLADLEWLTARGIRFRYDDGLASSASWAGEIAHAVKACAAFVVFLSPAAIASPYVHREILYAQHLGKPCLPVELDACELDDELEFLFSSMPRLSRRTLPRARYERELAERLQAFGASA